MDYAAGLLAQNRLLTDLLGEADLSRPVPTCPGWDLTQLMCHVGRWDRWAAAMVRNRALEYGVAVPETPTPNWSWSRQPATAPASFEPAGPARPVGLIATGAHVSGRRFAGKPRPSALLVAGPAPAPTP